MKYLIYDLVSKNYFWLDKDNNILKNTDPLIAYENSNHYDKEDVMHEMRKISLNREYHTLLTLIEVI